MNGTQVAEKAPRCEIAGHGRSLEFRLSQEPLATYILDPAQPRPFLGDLTGPGGRVVTRPLDLSGVPEESRDHPHHRGVWTGHRSVGGADFWTDFDGHGRIVHRGGLESVAGPGRIRVSHRLHWLDGAGLALLIESRALQFYPEQPDGSRFFDIRTTLLAPPGHSVTLADTKDAGLVALRVAPSMEERRGGRIEKSDGVAGEEQCWVRPARWCDYSGPVDGATVGIAIFDHPANPRYPTTWHVRDYGLMAANPFGYEEFFPGQDRAGALRITDTQPVTFRYRLLIHPGDATAGRVAARYQDFVAA